MNRFMLSALALFQIQTFAADQLDHILKETEMGKPDFKTIDQVINQHPNPRADFTMRVIASDSSEGASDLYPRYLPADPRSGLLMGFNGHESQTGYRTLQLAQPNGDFWDWAQIVEKDGRLLVQRRPKTCLKCHGPYGSQSETWVPIVDTYPEWEGALGESHDTISAEKLDKYQAHVGLIDKDSRYKNFIKDPIGDEEMLARMKQTLPTEYAEAQAELARIGHVKKGEAIQYLSPALKGAALFNRRPNTLFGAVAKTYHAQVLAQRSLQKSHLGDYLNLLHVKRCLRESAILETVEQHAARGRFKTLLGLLLSKDQTPDESWELEKFWNVIQSHFLEIPMNEANLRGSIDGREAASYQKTQSWTDGTGQISERLDEELIARLSEKQHELFDLPRLRVKKKYYESDDDAQFAAFYARYLSDAGLNPNLKTWNLTSDKDAPKRCLRAIERMDSLIARLKSEGIVPTKPKAHRK